MRSMIFYLGGLLLVTATPAVAAQSSRVYQDSVRQIVANVLATTPLVDGHNDFIAQFISGDSLLNLDSFSFQSTNGQTDLERWRRGGVGGSFATIGGTYSPNVAKGVDATLELLHRLAARNPEHIAIARTSSDVRRAHAAGKVGLMPHLEGAEQLGGSIIRLRELHAAGLVSVGLTWNSTNDLSDAALDVSRWNGLSQLGRIFVKELNDLGVVVDISHASDAAALEAVRTSRAPVILSHSSLRSVANVRRNVSDPILRAVAEAGGVVMITFVPYFTTDAYAKWYERGELVWDSLKVSLGDSEAAAPAMKEWERSNPAPSVDVTHVADHLDRARALVGIEHVGLASDFDGMFSSVIGLEDASAFPNILIELAGRGWTEPDLRKVAGENILRVLDAVALVSAAKQTLQRQPPN